MSVDVIRDLWVCQDCLFALANGGYPDDPETTAAIQAGEERELPYRWVVDSPATGEHGPECHRCDGTGKSPDSDDETCNVFRYGARRRGRGGVHAHVFVVRM